MIKRTVYITALLFIILNNNFAQHHTTARLRIDYGASVEFIFNTFTKYQTGITYSNWTQLSVYFVDTLDDGTAGYNWALDVKANQSNIIGDFGGNLDLSYIELFATSTSADEYGGAGTPQILSTSDLILLENGTQSITEGDVKKALITYRCGVTTPLLGKTSGYYSVDLIFTLRADP